MKRALLLLATAPWLGCMQYLFGGWADHQAAVWFCALYGASSLRLAA